MTTFKKIVLALILAVSLGFAACDIVDTQKHSHHYHAPATIQESATHMIGLGTEPGDMDAGCTATAIGPHVLMTAAHCDPDEKFSVLRVDLSTRDYVILNYASDGRDHILLAIDGPAFTNIAPYNVRKARMGEHVYVWGDGEGQFPSRVLSGRVVNQFDPSDVDAAASLFYISNATVHGDSGSVIYGDDGYMLGLVTYGEDGEARASGFGLDFTPNDIKYAQTFVPLVADAPLPVKPVKPVALSNPFGVILGK
jgi:hypothetical protein